jgi:hypothetical protein
MKRVLLWSLFLILLMTSCVKSNNQPDTRNKDIKANTGISSRSILNVKILNISFYDENGNKLNPIAGWIHLQKNTKIVVTYSGNADQIDYIFTPTGTETYNLQKIIGNSFVGPNDTKAEFVWTPSADQTLGYINISINQGNYSVKSDLINVTYQ